jgi:hypothetical protein
MTLSDLLSAGDPDVAAVEAYLDGLDSTTRLAEARSLGRRAQARLFEAAAGHRALALTDFVPADTKPMVGVVHHGKNSLPAFNRFAKVFCRPDAGSDEELWGYNRNSPLVETTVGPGYFVAYGHGDGELLIDYLRVPPKRPDPWPEILPNAARLSRFVYHRTQDVVRGVSRHVSIGRMTKNGTSRSNWFVLCRED